MIRQRRKVRFPLRARTDPWLYQPRKRRRPPAASAAPVGVTLGQATETDSSSSLTLTKTKVLGQATETDSAFPMTAATPFPYPASVSGRKVLDQNGNVFPWRSFSSWGMPYELTNAEITTAIDDLADNGFNGLTIWIGGAAFNSTGWNQYTNENGDPMWTGTPFQSTLGSGWNTVDWIVQEAARRHMTVTMSFSYIGVQLTDSHWTNASNAQMQTAGADISTRYLAYDNIAWHIMFDWPVGTGTTPATRIDNLFLGINNTEGSTRRLRWIEVDAPNSTNSAGYYNFSNIKPLINCWYNNAETNVDNAAEIVEGTYAEITAAIGDCEPPYDNSPHYTGNIGQELRERSYSTFIEGGILINYGHESWWPFGANNGADTGADAGGVWTGVQADSHTIQMSYAWSLIDTYVADTAWAPTSSFVTTGEGSGDTKAAQGASTDAALAYFPDNRTIVVDTTIITGTANVRLRWFDPTAGTFSTIAASEAQQTGRSVTLPAARGDGTRDFVLVVDLVPELILGQASETDTAQTMTLTKTVTLGLPSETDSSSPLTRTKTVVFGLASETDTSAPLTMTETATLGLASETDSGLALTVTETVTLGLASETDTALPLTKTETATLGLASETDTSSALTVTETATLGLASETDSGLALTETKTKVLGIATETDIGLPMSTATGTVMGLAVETDTGLPMVQAKTKVLGQAVETDIGLPLGISFPGAGGSLNVCFEVDAPVFVDRTPSMLFAHGDPGDALIRIRSVDGAVFNARDAVLEMVIRQSGVPVFRDRSAQSVMRDRTATVTFGHGEPDDPQIACEE